jgi:WD40 repeat protein
VDRSIRIWDPLSERLVLRLDAGIGPVWGLAFSPDGRRIAAAMGDWRVSDRPGSVKVWDATDGRELLSLAAHRGIAWSVAFSPDGLQLASGGFDKTVKLWDATPLKGP